MHTMDTIHRENTIYHVYKLDSLLFLTKTLFEDSNNLYYSKTLLVLIYKEKRNWLWY